MRRRKFNNVPTFLDGYRFDSKMEASRYGQLKMLKIAKEISELVIHPQYPIEVNGFRVCVYEADFRYKDRNGVMYVEDVKGARTALFSLKKKLMKAVNGIDVQEIKVPRGGKNFPGVDIDKVHRKVKA